MPQTSCPLLGFVAFSGTGKTTLLTRLLPLLKSRGLRIGMIKHAHHTFDIDIAGKDSYELRKAGADQMLVASRSRWALMVETPEQEGDPQLDSVINRLQHDSLDIILVEGFKHVRYPKVELYRPSLGHPLLFPQDDGIIAIATDAPLSIDPDIRQLDLNNHGAIADFVEAYIHEFKHA